MTTFNGIIFLILAFVFGLFISKIIDNNKNKPVISFRESLDLTGLPIVTFKQGKDRLNFILDTGASKSLIDSNILSNIEYEELADVAVSYGVDGIAHETPYVGIVLSYNGKEYPEAFKVMDMATSFGKLKEDYGVNVHGLLSSHFFENYSYVLDFAEMVAYGKNN